MLTGITLENFKAFKEPQYIPIKPITLVFGPNSAGKSSIMHALAFLKHVAGMGDCDPGVVEYGWDQIHLGSWQNLIYGHDTTATMRITLHYNNGGIMWSFSKTSNNMSQVNEFFVFGHGSDAPYDIESAIAKGINLANSSITWKFFLHSNHPYIETFKKELFELMMIQSKVCTYSLERGYNETFSTWNKLVWHEIPESSESNFGPEYCSLFPIADEHDKYGKDISPSYRRPNESENERRIFCESQIAILIEKADDLIHNIDFNSYESHKILSEILQNSTYASSRVITPPCTKILHEILVDEMHNLSGDFNTGGGLDGITNPVHVGAYRMPPKDRISRRVLANKIGMEAWKKLLDEDLFGADFHKLLLNKSLARLEINYTAVCRDIEYISYSAGTSKNSSKPCVEDYYKDRELVFVDKDGSSHPISSLGSGVGVVSSVLVALATAGNELVTIEEPECHLHPKLQSEMGDVLIERSRLSTDNGPNIYVETHSEHLILRILRRIRETTENEMDYWPDELRIACPNGIRPEDLAVLYVQPGENGSEVIDLPVDANGEFTCDWPGGFFEERMKEFF